MEKVGGATMLYMTGTGNTARAAGIIGAQLADAGWAVSKAELRRAAPLPEEAHSAELLVICFPVLGFGMPELVRAQLRGLRGGARRAAVFATWGGEGGASLWQARLFLKRRGFRVVATGGASYPFQWTQVIAPPGPAEAGAWISGGDAAARAFGQRLISGDPRGRRGWLGRAVSTILCLPISWLYRSIGRHGLAAMYAADGRCRSCGTCVRSCIAGAIALTGAAETRRPRWRTGLFGPSCEGCNRCINLCPQAAVQTSPLRAGVHLALNAAVILAIVLGLNAISGVAAVSALPALVRVPAYIVALVAATVLGSRLQFAALEPALFEVESRPAVRKLIARSWTARFPRYLCPGFRPGRGQAG